MLCRKCPKCGSKWYSASEKVLDRCERCYTPLRSEDDVEVNPRKKAPSKEE